MWRPLMRNPSALDKKKKKKRHFGLPWIFQLNERIGKIFAVKGGEKKNGARWHSEEQIRGSAPYRELLWFWASFVHLVHSIECVWAVDGQLGELTPVSDVVEVYEELLFGSGQDSGLTWWGQDRSLWSELIVKVTDILPSFNGGDERRTDLLSQQSSPVHVLMERQEREKLKRK